MKNKTDFLPNLPKLQLTIPSWCRGIMEVTPWNKPPMSPTTALFCLSNKVCFLPPGILVFMHWLNDIASKVESSQLSLRCHGNQISHKNQDIFKREFLPLKCGEEVNFIWEKNRKCLSYCLLVTFVLTGCGYFMSLALSLENWCGSSET